MIRLHEGSKASIIFVLICMLLMPAAYAFNYEGFTFNGHIESRGIKTLNSGTPNEDMSYELELDSERDIGSWGKFRLALKAVDDGKVINPTHNGVFDTFNRVYQDRDQYINVDEAYIDIYTNSADFRLGIQKFAWGRLDEINPTDNLNTQDLTEFAFPEQNVRKIGIPAFKADIYSDLFNTEIAWIPRYIPYRLPTPEERWFPPILKPPTIVHSSTGDIPVISHYEDVDLPAFKLSNSEIGIRISKYIKGWDASISYFSGYDPTPLIIGTTDITVELLDPSSFKTQIRADAYVKPSLHRMQVFGFDFTNTIGKFTLRGECAYYAGKYYSRKTEDIMREETTKEKQKEIMDKFMKDYIESGMKDTRQVFHTNPDVEVKKNSMKYGLGVDYIKGDTTLSVQWIQEYIFDYDKSRPVYLNKKGVDTTFTLSLKQLYLQDTLEIGLDGMYGVEFRQYLIKPYITYSFTDNLKGTIEARILQGRYTDSAIGQFRDNDEIFARMKYSF